MLELASGWTIEAERGPDMLFVRLHAPKDLRFNGDEIADHLWSLLEEHFTYRMVLELDNLSILQSNIIGQLVKLYKRTKEHEGLLRISGLSPKCQEILKVNRLESCLPQYRSREEAVMGPRVHRPR